MGQEDDTAETRTEIDEAIVSGQRHLGHHRQDFIDARRQMGHGATRQPGSSGGASGRPRRVSTKLYAP